MILLVGIETDRILKYFANFLISHKKNVVFLNQKKIGLTNHIHSSFISINNVNYYYAEFTGVLNRMADIHPDNMVTNAYYNSIILLSYIIDNALPNTLNPLKYCVANNSKLYQVNALKRNLIRLPRSNVLAKKPHSVVANINGKTIFKSLSAVRSKVIKYEKDLYHIDRLVSSEPVLFQELLTGYNIRVHVIKDNVIAIKIKSSQIDYRYDPNNRSFEEINLPKEIEIECLCLSMQANLKFCGIDLIVMDNNYYLLEINPSPGYLFFEENLGNTILSHALMEALSG